MRVLLVPTSSGVVGRGTALCWNHLAIEGLSGGTAVSLPEVTLSRTSRWFYRIVAHDATCPELRLGP